MASEKRILDTHSFWASHIIFDIEGTTTSISFVKDTLFPYVRKHLELYLNDNWNDEGFQSVVAALREQAKTDENDGLEGFVAIPEGDGDEVKNAVVKNVVWQMDNDRKTKSLKDLQSLVMTNGYKTGNIIGHIYDDVETNLKAWKDQGKHLYIYSSGSVNAQKLLFGNTNKGNLLDLFSGHFDTIVGPKTESSSYKKIVDEIKSEPGDVLFFTDVPAEAKAAVGAGLQAVLVSRDGNAPLSDQDRADFTVIHSLSDIEFEQSTKKRKMLNDTNCDIVIDNKEVEHSSTYISETIRGEGDDHIKPNISVDTDVEMVEVEEKTICTEDSKEGTKTIEEAGNCKESDVDVNLQPNPELTKDNSKIPKNIDENTAILNKNEIDRTSIKTPDVKEKNDLFEGKKDNDTERKKNDVEGKKEDDAAERKKGDVEDKKEHNVEETKEHDSTVVAQKKKFLADDNVGKEGSVIYISEDTMKPVEELNDNTVRSIKELSDNQQANTTNSEDGEVESEVTDNEIKKSPDNSDEIEIELSRKSEIQEEAVEERSESSPVDKDKVETVQTSKIDISLSENDKLGLGDVGIDEVENKLKADVIKETGHEKNIHVMTVIEDKDDDVKEPIKSDSVSCSASSTTKVEVAEKTVSSNTPVEFAEHAPSNTAEVEMAENSISNTTAVEIAENVPITTTYESTDKVQPMDVSESNVDTECKADEENKPLSDKEMTKENKQECEQKIVSDEVTTEMNETSVCGIDTLPEKDIIEKENNVSKETELQEKLIIENSVCSKMETENCDVVSDICEKDNIHDENVDAKKTVNDNVELQKEQSKSLSNDDVCSSVGNINKKENNEDSVKTENSEIEAVCVNNLNETKVESSDESAGFNTIHEKENSSAAKEKEDVTATSVSVNGKRAENDSCDTEKNDSHDDSKAQVEMTANGDTHENVKTDDEKTDNIHEKTESNAVVNGGTENVTDSVPEVKKVISDAANNSALEAISQPV